MVIGEVVGGLSSRVAERGLGGSVASAALFWGGGLAAWSIDNRLSDSWDEAERWLDGRGDFGLGAVVALVAVLIGISALVVDRLSLFALRFLEGYWRWPPLKWLGPPLVARRARWQAKADTRWQTLAQRTDQWSPQEAAAFERLDRTLRRLPTDPSDLLPTRLGNVLRSAERWPEDKYGLDPIVCWPRLWLLLPEVVRGELAVSRKRLDVAATGVLWGLAFAAWTPLTWWALPVGLVVAAIAYGWALGHALSYGDLVESAYDLHRSRLYRAMRLPLPAAPADEQPAGRALTALLWRGSDASWPRYLPPAD